ncbi:MAG: hypothetical protein JSU07_06175 [Bacteroidetes bacterium]|nr:hypothetical protein [Bacteroidota bacterium]
MKQFIFLILFTPYINAQTKQFVIIDSATKKGIPYVAVGVLGKHSGYLSDENGVIEINLNYFDYNDSIKINCLGYNSAFVFKKNLLEKTFKTIQLSEQLHQLEEVDVKVKKVKTEILGAKHYSIKNCTGFVKNEQNWKGSEASICADNKVGRLVLLKSFSFYVIQNKYSDSLIFRLMFYEASDKKYPRYKSILKRPIIFKTALKQGEFTLDISNYNITTDKDFFVSLECLMNEMDITKFCYAGSYSRESFVRSGPFSRWYKTKGGGADLKVVVSYNKE